MSITSAMSAGVSGLITNSSALAAISDNIANVNTTAYKRNSVSFGSVVTAQSVAGRYSAGGVKGIVHQYVSQQGLVQTANSATDLAINGPGFFVVTTKGANLQPSDARMFTRSGSFTVDADGFLVNDAGLYLQGWPTQPGDTYNVSPSDLNKLQSIDTDAIGAAVAPTQNVSLTANVDKRVQLSTPMGTVPPIEMQIVDESGGTHTLRLTMVPTATIGDWTATLSAVPASETAAATIATGTLTFNSDGTLDPASAGLAALGSITMPWAASTGLDPTTQIINFDYSSLTARPMPSTVDTISQDGAGPGKVNGVQISDDGIVSVTFDNSQVRQIAKIALATFPNPDGMRAVAGNAYMPTNDGGQMVIKQPGVGAGSISPSSLESSTVDLSAEFTGLITTQKAYSASSKIITTADQMLDELIQMKR